MVVEEIRRKKSERWLRKEKKRNAKKEMNGYSEGC